LSYDFSRHIGEKEPLGEGGSPLGSGDGSMGSVMRPELGGQSQSGVSGRLQPPPPSSSLLLDALDPDDAEAGVFIANVRL
jgi:hypothetical protein